MAGPFNSCQDAKTEISASWRHFTKTRIVSINLMMAIEEKTGVFVLCGSLMFVQNLLTIHFKVVEIFHSGQLLAAHASLKPCLAWIKKLQDAWL